MATDPTLGEVFWALVDPWMFMGLSLARLPGTVTRLVKASDWATLLSPSRFRAAWFADFWAAVSPGVREGNEPGIVPLLKGRVHDGEIFPLAKDDKGTVVDDGKDFHPAVSGIVLDIGPGSGIWVDLFSDKHLSPTPAKDPLNNSNGHNLRHRTSPITKITHIYGVEPNRDTHPPLRQRIKQHGLDDIYEVVPLGIGELASAGVVQKGEVDSIVTLQCLCSIPDPQENIKELATYLKPGGRWYVYEHVKCSKPMGIVWYQGISS
jgi:SAM-dependent methyltransferase